MRKTKEQGITLIALIITIILMLILVGVTVSVALNGGLFKTAKDAATGTQVEADRETLQAGVVGALDKNELKILTAKILEDNLPEGWKVTGENEGPYVATSPNKNSFKVEQDGAIDDVIARNSTELERYIFGENGLGRDLKEIFFEDDPYGGPFTWYFIEPPVDLEPILRSNIQEGEENIDELYIKCEDKTYKIQVAENTDNHTRFTLPEKGMKLVYDAEKETKVGKVVQYDGELWLVLYDDDINGLQMVGGAGDSIKLGYSDTSIVESKVEDFDGVEGLSNFEKAIYSYNHAIETLNKKCESLVTPKEGIIKGVRALGSNPVESDGENTTLYTSKSTEMLMNGIGDKRGYGADYNFSSDFDKLVSIGWGQVAGSCWLASRQINDDSDYVTFTIRCPHFASDNKYCYMSDYDSEVWGVNKVGEEYSRSCSKSTIAVIVLEPGALDGLAGEGTMENPWILQ